MEATLETLQGNGTGSGAVLGHCGAWVIAGEVWVRMLCLWLYYASGAADQLEETPGVPSTSAQGTAGSYSSGWLVVSVDLNL